MTGPGIDGHEILEEKHKLVMIKEKEGHMSQGSMRSFQV